MTITSKLLLLLTIASSCYAQNARKDDVASLSVTQQTSAGTVSFLKPIAGATITVCSSLGTGTPCNTPLTGLCLSATDLVCSQPNPFNADTNGNYGFWLPPGRYVVSITAIGVTGRNITYDIVASNGTTPGSFTTITCTIVNVVRCVSPTNPQGWAGTDVGGWINSAAGSGNVKVQVGAGSYSYSTIITLPVGTELQGDGSGTILQYTGVGNPVSLSGAHITLQDLTVSCTNVSNAGSGIAGNGGVTDDIHLERVNVSGCFFLVNGGGLAGGALGTWYISNSKFSNALSGGDGVYTGLAGRFVMKGITVTTLASGNCIDLNTSGNILADSWLINCNTSNTHAGNNNDIDIQATTGQETSRNIITHVVILETNAAQQPNQAIRISPISGAATNNNQITNCIIVMAGNGQDGIATDGVVGATADGTIIQGNFVTGANHAIYLFTNSGTLSNTNISGNNTSGNTHGILINSGATGTILGVNNSYSNSSDQIVDNGTDAPILLNPVIASSLPNTVFGIARTSVAGSTTLLAANSCGDTVTVTVTGATTSMDAHASSTISAGLIERAWVSSANTVSVQYCNVTAAGIVPSAATLQVTVFQ